MPNPVGVDGAAQILWGPQSGGIGDYEPDANNRRIITWGYEKTTLIVEISDFGTDPFDAVRIKPLFGYRYGAAGATIITSGDQFELTQVDQPVSAGVVGAAPVNGAEDSMVMLTRAFPRRWEQGNLSSSVPQIFRMDLDNRGAHYLSCEVAINRTAGSGDVITVYAVRWSTGRSNQ